jgi:hypothetical protein
LRSCRLRNDLNTTDSSIIPCQSAGGLRPCVYSSLGKFSFVMNLETLGVSWAEEAGALENPRTTTNHDAANSGVTNSDGTNCDSTNRDTTNCDATTRQATDRDPPSNDATNRDTTNCHTITNYGIKSRGATDRYATTFNTTNSDATNRDASNRGTANRYSTNRSCPQPRLHEKENTTDRNAQAKQSTNTVTPQTL